MAIAQHIIDKYQLIDVIDIRGIEEYQTVNVELPISNNVNGLVENAAKKMEKTYNTKMWNPINWAYFL